MQTEIERMMRNVTVVASIMPNDKLNTEYEFFSVYTPTSMRGLFRYWSGETRETNVSKIQASIRQAAQFVQASMQNEVTTANNFSGRMKAATQIQQCQRILDTLRKAVTGIDNLKQTYKDDASIVAKLHMIRNEIEDFLNATNTVMLHDKQISYQEYQQVA